MRYSRMQEERPEEKKSGRAGGLVLILVAAAVILYIVGAGKSASFLSEKIIKPVISVFTEDTPTEDSPEEEDAVVSTELTFPALELYALQVGVFTESENADKSAKTIADMGGAGYVFEDHGNYRVIIAGYLQKEDAESVKSRLMSEQSMESKILELSADKTEFTVNSKPDVTAVFESISEEMGTFHKQIMELSLKLDKGNITTDDAKAELQSFAETVRTRQDFLRDLTQGTEDVLAANALKYYEALSEEFQIFSSGLSDIEFSSALKHTYLSAAYSYQNFLKTAES